MAAAPQKRGQLKAVATCYFKMMTAGCGRTGCATPPLAPARAPLRPSARPLAELAKRELDGLL